MKIIKNLTVIIIITMLTSCASEMTKNIAMPVVGNAVDEANSTITIYRPHSMSNIMVTPKINIDGKNNGVIKNKSHVVEFVGPGDHIIKLILDSRYRGQQQLKVKVEADENIYIRVATTLKFEMNKPYSRSFSLELVEESQALKDVKSTEYVGGHKKQSVRLKSDSRNNDEYSISKSRNPFSK